MLLTDFVGGNVPDYLEFGWVTAPNDTGQSIVANTITTLSCTNIVSNPSSLAGVSIANHQFTIPAGTYYFEAETALRGSLLRGAILSLNNVTNTTDISEKGSINAYSLYSGDGDNRFAQLPTLNGQFILTSPATLRLRILTDVAAIVTSGTFSNSTLSADQRTTAKFWKLK